MPDAYPPLPPDPPSVPQSPAAPLGACAVPVARKVDPVREAMRLQSISPFAALLAILAVVLLAVVAPPILTEVCAGRWTREAALVFEKSVSAAVGIALLTFAAWRTRSPHEAFGLTAQRPGLQIGVGLATVPVIYLVMVAVGVAALVVSLLAGADVESEAEQRFETLRDLPLGSFAISIPLLLAVAIHEEAVFRGLLLPLTRRLTGSWIAAVILTSLLFGLLHFAQGMMAMIQITGISIVLSIAFYVSRSLWAVIGAHFVFDLIQFQLIHVLAQWMDELEKAAQ